MDIFLLFVILFGIVTTGAAAGEWEKGNKGRGDLLGGISFVLFLVFAGVFFL